MQTETESVELIVILALVAVFILFQLRRTLGKKTGYDPTKDQPKDKDAAYGDQNDDQRSQNNADDEDNVYPILPDAAQVEPAVNLGLSKSSPFYAVIEKIHQIDPSFNVLSFFDGAEYAYGLVLNSFWNKDRKTLRSMLSRQVYDQFSGAIDDMEKKKLRHENRLMDVEKIDLLDVTLTGSLAEVTVEFTSHMIMSTRDADDRIIEGNADRAIKISDIWTFCRDVKSTDPNWTLVATRTG